jgi:phosphate:Na+ symporter
VGDMLLKTQEAMAAEVGRRAAIAEVKEQNVEINELHKQISAYISTVLASTAVTESQSEQLASMLLVNNNIARVAERCVEIVTIASEQPEGKLKLSDEGRLEMNDIFELVLELYNNTFTALKEHDRELAESVIMGMNKMRKLIKKANKNHLRRLNTEDCTKGLEEAYPAILYAISRMGDSASTLSEEVLETDEWEHMALDVEDDRVDNSDGEVENKDSDEKQKEQVQETTLSDGDKNF